MAEEKKPKAAKAPKAAASAAPAAGGAPAPRMKKHFEDVVREVPGVAEVAVIGVPDEQTGEAVVAYVRPLAGMLDKIAASDARPLSTARAPDRRYVCVCRSFALLMVAMLRSQGVPARARCGRWPSRGASGSPPVSTS